jgi:aryl sulfotransferase
MTAKLLLVCSYPKSGNTWARLVFDMLRRGVERDISINEIDGALHGYGRRVLFDKYAGINAAELTFEEIESTLPEVFRIEAQNRQGQVLVKVHDYAHRAPNGTWLFPPECVSSVIYLVRHPFDVAVSFASHLDESLARTVEIMGADDVSPRQYLRLPLPLPQRMGTWGGNVVSWLGSTPYRVTMARYEDLHADPVEEFRRLATAAGFAVSTEDIVRVMEATRFERLQDQEKESSFREKPARASIFFRSGRPRSWEGVLDNALREKLVRDHGEVMERLGYGADGSIAPLPQRGRS